MAVSSGNWLVWALGSAVFAALTGIFAKVGLNGINTHYALLIRTAIVNALLVGILAYTKAWTAPWHLPVKTWGFLVLSALATGASWICYFRALQLGTVSQVAPIDKLSVVLAILFAVAFLHERPSPREWAGIALIASGALVIAWR
ncbi:MAG: EamA family transporter [Kiritimatiellaeota bacterium]|nr:EamA family transporter [Kiritimatiellota bacterium]